MTLKLKAQKREALGTKAIKDLRAKGLIPAELYGKGVENVHLSVDSSEFDVVYKEGGESTIVNVDFGDGQRPVLIHDIHIDPVSSKILNIDFYEVNLKEKIVTNIPLEFIGEAPAVKDMEGVLIKTTEEIEIEALPMNIPQHIDVDVSVLDDFDKSIYVRDLKAGVDFEIKTDPDTVIASVSEPREEEEEPEEEMSVEDVVVEGEKPGEDEESEGADDAGGGEEKKPEGDN